MMIHNTFSSTVPTPLLSLPRELLTQIVLQLDRKSALSLSTVCRALNPLSYHRIYRDLDLYLPAAHGEYPLVQPYPRWGYREHLTWAKAEARAAEDRHREALKEKVKTILLDAGKRRLGMVQNITVIPRPGAINAILSLLEAVSPNLKSLTLEPPAEHVFASAWRASDYETLDVKLLGYGLTFSGLTHLVVRKYAVRFAETVLEICLAAPTLVSVDAQEHICANKSVWPAEGPMPALADVVDIELSSIRHLRLEFHDYWNSSSRSSLHPFVQLIIACDELEQLELLYTPDEDDTREYLVQTLRTKQELRDMYWEVTPKSFYPRPKKGEQGNEDEESVDDEDDEYVDGFENLERLVMGPANYLETLSNLPSSDSLATLHILEPTRGERRVEPPRPTRYPEPSPHPTMHPMLAKRLRETPFLSTINSLPMSTMPTFAELDEIERSDQITGTIRSFVKKGSTYGSDELLHARLYLFHTQISDTLCTARPTYTKRGETYTTYHTADGSERLITYKDCPKGEWVDMTDFGGVKVPLDVIANMRKVQGVTEAEWQGRRVEVGEEAWAVLIEWRDRKVTGHQDIRKFFK